MTHILKNINYWNDEHADFILHETVNPLVNPYTCGSIQFDNGIYFARIWDNEQLTLETFSTGLNDYYGTLSVFYYPNHLVDEALKRISLVREAILQKKMVSRELSIEEVPKKDYSRIGFVPWFSEHAYFALLTKKTDSGLFVVTNNNDQNDCNEFEYFSIGEPYQEFNPNKFCATSGEENTGGNSIHWLKKNTTFLKALE